MDLIRKLRELEKENKVYISHWIDDADKLGVSNEMLREAVQLFLAEHKSGKAFFIISLVFERLGTRNDIEIMDRFIPESEEERPDVAYWKANASFLIKRRSLH